MLQRGPNPTSPSARAATILTLAFALAAVSGCGGERPGEPPSASAPPVEPRSPSASGPASRQAYFGDLHVHTRYSIDAYIFNVRASPDDAYRFAKGEAIEHPSGQPIQLRSGPLDFVAVTDHAEYLGVAASLHQPGSPLYDLEIARVLRGETGLTEREAFQMLAPTVRSGTPIDELDSEEVVRSTWSETIAAAERHYEPGTLTTFVAYEFTSMPESQNLHRNVIFRSSAVPAAPFSSFDSQDPEDLWSWLDARRAEGIEALAIPHNSNGSNGQMFRLADFAGQPLDAEYAAARRRNEPVVEITQTKGTSETHPMLSPNDEWAGFEIFPFRIASPLPSDVPGSYAREALRNGLELEQRAGFNPFRFGFIGSSDTHVAAGPFEEASYWSMARVTDPASRAADSTAPDQMPAAAAGRDPVADGLRGASGLAGVWAEENTRESIYDALRRGETFATSGPRIRVRLFAGFALPEGIAEDPEAAAKAYAAGVPMGGDLAGDGARSAPRFLAWAMRDPRSAPLQRVQIVKGWVEDGEAHERVYDVACSGGLVVDPSSRRCPDNGATVDPADCSHDEDAGAAELRAVWTDPDFDPSQRAFYYLRALENPTCRWSTWDALRAGVEPDPDLPATIQERAWSSPIWYQPVGDSGASAGPSPAAAPAAR